MGLPNFSINLRNPVFGPFFDPFSQFWGQKHFHKTQLLRTISYGFLAPCQSLEKTNDTNPRKCSDRRNDGRTDRPFS